MKIWTLQWSLLRRNTQAMVLNVVIRNIFSLSFFRFLAYVSRFMNVFVAVFFWLAVYEAQLSAFFTCATYHFFKNFQQRCLCSFFTPLIEMLNPHCGNANALSKPICIQMFRGWSWRVCNDFVNECIQLPRLHFHNIVKNGINIKSWCCCKVVISILKVVQQNVQVQCHYIRYFLLSATSDQRPPIAAFLRRELSQWMHLW